MEIWHPNLKIKILKIKIRVAQNVGKFWISRKKYPDPILGHLRSICPWTEKLYIYMIPAWTPNNKYILKLRNLPG